jgi:trehalose synthase
MWKGEAVVASAVGGIHGQIEDGRTGFVVDPADLRLVRVGEQLVDSLTERAKRIGEAVQRRVRDLFLGPRHFGEYVDLLDRVLG